MNKTQVILIKLVANELFGKRYIFPQLTDDEWRGVIKESQQQAVLLIAYNSAVKLGLSEVINSKWRIEALKNIKNNSVIEINHLQLHSWLKQAGIPYVVLKGCSSASYYPEPSDRAMGDVDFLVKKSDVERADRILKEQGLKPWEVDHICHIVYRAPRKHYEMHFDLSGVPHGKPGELVHKYIEDIFDKSFVYTAENGSMQLPSKFHHGLIILLHTSHHLTGEGIGLRHLCDWAVFLNSCSDEEFRELFEERFKAIGMWKFASVLSRICIKYLGCEPKNCLMNVDDELSKRLIDDILFGGNFGKKDSDRSFEGRIISDRGKSTVKGKKMLTNYINSINDVVHSNWPITKKYPLIMPFGWMFFGARRLYRILTGKRKKPKVFKSISVARKRRDLYGKLGIFEIKR